MPKFIRVLQCDGTKEVLLNLDRIWKIEVEYAAPAGQSTNRYVTTGLDEASVSPDAIRVYRIFIENEEIPLPACSDAVMDAIETIYKDAIKA